LISPFTRSENLSILICDETKQESMFLLHHNSGQQMLSISYFSRKTA
jgi:hypothetical protein